MLGSQGRARRVRGWARSKFSRSQIFKVKNIDEMRDTVSLGEVLPRGGGMSFGDAALNDSRILIETLALPRSYEMRFDNEKGILQCSAGITQEKILDTFAPKGWILSAIPGSKNITLGGSIAADGHGKNHYMKGSISQHLISMRIMLGTGEIVEISRDKGADLFWVTIGGLGLTGVILSVRLRLQKVSSVHAKHEIHGFNGVDGLIDLIEENKSRYEYILGWVNGNFKPGSSWQGAVSVGRNALSDEVEKPWILPHRTTIRVPFANPVPGTGILVARLVNQTIKKKFRIGHEEVVDLNRFFFPQDAITNWNLAFGRAGFVDYQCCVPYDHCREFFKELHQFFSKHRVFCFLVAVKRFGQPELAGPLTFAQEGYSIAVDMPIGSGTLGLLDSLDEIAVNYGGRINPIKDSRISPAMLRRMYPRLEEWLEIKEKYDPGRSFSSDLSRRLELTPG